MNPTLQNIPESLSAGNTVYLDGQCWEINSWDSHKGKLFVSLTLQVNPKFNARWKSDDFLEALAPRTKSASRSWTASIQRLACSQAQSA
jgi:hypothetical protein